MRKTLLQDIQTLKSNVKLPRGTQLAVTHFKTSLGQNCFKVTEGRYVGLLIEPDYCK